MLTLIAVTALLLAATAAASIPLTTLIAEQQVSLWKCQDQLQWPRAHPSVEPWSLPRSIAYRQWVLRVWTQRAGVCKAALHEQARQWNWQAWMPAHWQRLAQCEESMDWHHYGGGYEGSFAFATSTWDRFKLSGYPDSAANASPWQQWVVARRVAAFYHSIAGSWGCWRGPQHAWVRGGLPEHGTWQ